MSRIKFTPGAVTVRTAVLAAGWLGMTGPGFASLTNANSRSVAAVGAPAGTGAKPHASGVAVQVAELHRIKGELEKADHDYDGHRAEAVKLIAAAIHALTPHHKSGTAAKVPHPTKPTAAGTGRAKSTATSSAAKHKLPQATSDAILKTALTQLTAVKSQLAGKGTPADAASAEVSKAIGQLETVLKIK